jgi:hypothetical protein
MPLLNQSSVGGKSVVSSLLSRNDTYAFNATILSEPLFVDQLPNLVYWAVQTAGAFPAELVPQVAFTSVSILGVQSLDWIDLSAVVVMPPNDIPMLLNFEFPADFIRFKLSQTGPLLNPHTVRVVLAGYSP